MQLIDPAAHKPFYIIVNEYEEKLERLRKEAALAKRVLQFPDLPLGWQLASITVRRDKAWFSGGTLTYDATLECGGDYEARGSGRDPVAAVRAAAKDAEAQNVA